MKSKQQKHRQIARVLAFHILDNASYGIKIIDELELQPDEQKDVFNELQGMADKLATQSGEGWEDVMSDISTASHKANATAKLTRAEEYEEASLRG